MQEIWVLSWPTHQAFSWSLVVSFDLYPGRWQELKMPIKTTSTKYSSSAASLVFFITIIKNIHQYLKS